MNQRQIKGRKLGKFSSNSILAREFHGCAWVISMRSQNKTKNWVGPFDLTIRCHYFVMLLMNVASWILAIWGRNSHGISTLKMVTQSRTGLIGGWLQMVDFLNSLVLGYITYKVILRIIGHYLLFLHP